MDAKIHLMKRTVIKTVEILFKIVIKIVFCHWDKKGNVRNITVTRTIRLCSEHTYLWGLYDYVLNTPIFFEFWLRILSFYKTLVFTTKTTTKNNLRFLQSSF